MASLPAHRHPPRASLVFGVLIVGMIAAARGARAADDDGTCHLAHARAQESGRAAHLVEARELLQTCAKVRCGKVLYEACTAMLTQVEADLPSIVPVVTDGNGAARIDVQVTVDGKPLAERLDGRAFPVDPGMHEFAFTTSDGLVAARKLLVVQGQHNRAIRVSTGGSARTAADKKAVVAPIAPKTPDEPTAAPPEGTRLDAGNAVAEQQPKRGSPVLTFTLATVGVAGLAGFGLMTEWGRKDNRLLAQCSPFCPQASVDHVRRMYLAADISLGVGIASLVAAYWALASSRAANEEHPSEEALLFDLRPTASGAFAGVSGVFR